MHTDKLAEPVTLRCGAVLANRIAKAAMTEGLADREDRATPELCTLYRRWSEGGAGLLLTGNVMVDRRFLERPGNVVIDRNGGDLQLQEWVKAGTSDSNHLWMQISHPGRQCNRAASTRPLAPSAVPLKLAGMFGQPVPMDEDDIQDAIGRYARVASLAQEAGFTGVQIHAAHGYLISQFLSPLTNQRGDAWGGSLENRARFVLETVRAVRQSVGTQFPIGVKLNSSDFQKGAFSFVDCIQVAQWLDQEGIDLLEISGGTYEQPQLLGHSGRGRDAIVPQRESTRDREAYFLEYARRIKDSVEVPLMVTGGFRSRAAMLTALDARDTHVVGLGRPLCVDTDLPKHLIEGSIEHAPSWETTLNLGQGFFGPTSPLLALKIINVQGEVAWFYRQLVLLSQGREPDRDLGLLRALGQHLVSESRLVKRRVYRRDNKR
jgi:2,4-dienoyl-CoA reductase-like NADH-dependent reductase (Old Yellow Enzyme family)